MSFLRRIAGCKESMAAVYSIQFVFSIIPDSKRQQTTTVDNKRLINGFFLTRVASLLNKSKVINDLTYYHIKNNNKTQQSASFLLKQGHHFITVPI